MSKLSTMTKEERKNRPVMRGLLDYFPDACAAVANVSYVGNEQHNPGQEMHWARHKSSDQEDCLVRHLMERGTLDDDGLRHTAKVAWRALALLQLEIEAGVVNRPAEQDMMKRTGEGSYEEIREGMLGFHAVDGSAFDGFLKTPLPHFYICGPMRGMPLFNFPAFDEARDRGRAMGLEITSPADLDRAVGFNPAEDSIDMSDLDFKACVSRDIQAIVRLDKAQGDGLAVLPGWEKSVGSIAEIALANWLGLRVVSTTDFKSPITHTIQQLVAGWDTMIKSFMEGLK